MKSKRSPDESNEDTAMITTMKATHKLLITIRNYEAYQVKRDDESNGESNDGKPAKQPRKQRQPDNTNNNDNNDNKKPNSSSRKNAKRIYEADNRYYKMALYFHEKIMAHAAMNKVEHLVRNADMQKWAEEFRKIIELDKRDSKELQSIIDWSTAHHFWSSNILSPKKLREKYRDLGIKMAAEVKATIPTGGSRHEQNKELLKAEMEEFRNEQRGSFENPLFGDCGLPYGTTQ